MYVCACIEGKEEETYWFATFYCSTFALSVFDGKTNHRKGCAFGPK
jgi:hypothetical protein